MTRPLEEITEELVHFLKHSSKGQSKAPAGKLIVQARVNFFTDSKGNPDYQGRSWECRQWLGSVYDNLGLPHDERTKLAAAVRYASANALREVVSQEELVEMNLAPTSPRARAKAAYDEIVKPYYQTKQAQYTEEEAFEIIVNALSKVTPSARESIFKRLS